MRCCNIIIADKIELIDTNSLIPYIRNSRTHSEEQVIKIASSIKEFGFICPVLIDESNGIIAGHGRIMAAKKLGIEKVPCVRLDHMTESQRKAYIIADNRLALDAGWDKKLLTLELKELKEDFDFSLALTGFEENEIDDLLLFENDSIEDNFDIDSIIAVNKTPTCKTGDIWKLGRHRLMCGDSTVMEDVEKLMNGVFGDMIFTDPPYNVDYEGSNGKKIKNDSMSNDQFYKFLLAAYTTMIAAVKPGSPIYVCHADSEGINFRTAMRMAGWELKQCIIWIKNSFVMGRQDHHWQHEPILYGWKPGAKHKWYGGRNKKTVILNQDGVYLNKTEAGYQITVNDGPNKIILAVPSYELLDETDDGGTTTWFIDKPLKNGEHPTMKPITLCTRAIKNSSKEGDIVVDTFGGSGSTLIAAEKINRICYTMEMDPVYADAIITRWEQLTGGKAELVSGGK